MDAAALEEKCALFMAVTGSTVEQAKQFLEMSLSDVDRAVELFFSTGAGSGSAGGAARTDGDAALAAEVAAREEDGVRAPIAIKRDTLYDDDGRRGDLEARRLIEEQERADEAFTRFGALPAAGTSGRASRSAKRFRDGVAGEDGGALESLFLPPRDLLFQAPDLDSARERALAENKWLLVNIQSASEFASHRLNRDTWSDPTVKEAVRAGFLLVQHYDTTEPGRKFSDWYGVGALPCVAVVDPLTGTKVFAREGQFLDPQTLLDALLPFMDAPPVDGQPEAQGQGREEEECEEEEEEEEEEECEEEPPAGDPGAVVVAVNLADGTRAKRRFAGSSKLGQIFTWCRSRVPEARGRKFKLVSRISGVLGDKSETLEEAQVGGQALMMVWL